MPHVNKQVRDAVAAELAGTSLVQVDTNRGADLLAIDLPAGIIGTGTGQVERWTKGPTDLRNIDLTLVLVVDGESGELDDLLDALSVEVEPRVRSALEGLAHEVRYTGWDLDMGQDEEGERWFAFLVHSWEVEVETAADNPEVAL